MMTVSAIQLTLKFPNRRRSNRTITDLQKFAIEKGGICLSKYYTNSKSKYLWCCSKGHIWEAAAEWIMYQGSWCPQCNPTTRTISINEMHQLAADKGGVCLSKSYINDTSKLRWACSLGHEWEAAPGWVKQGTWCPKCQYGLSERICRAYFEQLFNANFPKICPEWLRYVNGRKLELDGYNENLKLAFEHQGLQHYEPVKYFNGNCSYTKILRRDEFKAKICAERGILLICIPSLNQLLYEVELKNFIKTKLILAGRPLPINFEQTEIDLSKTSHEDWITKYQKIAFERGGRLLSNAYLGAHTKLAFECKEGHQFNCKPNDIRKGVWCSKCKSKRISQSLQKVSLHDLQNIAEQNGGICLSTIYKNRKDKYSFKCSKGHSFSTTGSQIFAGRWCQECGYERTAIAAEKRLSYPVSVYDLSNKLLFTRDTIKDAATTLIIDFFRVSLTSQEPLLTRIKAAIGACCNGKRTSAYGYKFKKCIVNNLSNN